MRKIASIVTVLLTSGCMVGPDYSKPDFKWPEQWSQETTAKADAQPVSIESDWWKNFNDPRLIALVEEGLQANADIALAAARVSEARAALDLADAQLYPSISAEASGVRQKQSGETINARLSGAKPFNSFALSAVLNYEIDLWGRLRRANELARAQLLAQQANRDAVQLAVASDIATGYFNLLALNAQEKITQQTIASRTSSYDYLRKQYNAGAIDVLTFKRGEAELAAAKAVLPALAQSRVQQQNALSILLGRNPQEIIEKMPQTSQDIAALPVPPVMPAGTPSSILQRRPDVTAAEQQLIAANADIGVARAQYYPSLSLSALFGLGSMDIDRLLRASAETWSIGAASAMPLLDFGRTTANVESAEARKEQSLITYQQTVRQAVVDVANALNAQRTSAAREDALAQQVRANKETVRVANLRFDAGYSTQLDQLDAERQLYAAQLDEVSARQDRLSATVTLYKALGGGWSAGNSDAATANVAKKEAPAKDTKKPAAPQAKATPPAPALPENLPFKKARP